MHGAWSGQDAALAMAQSPPAAPPDASSSMSLDMAAQQYLATGTLPGTEAWQPAPAPPPPPPPQSGYQPPSLPSLPPSQITGEAIGWLVPNDRAPRLIGKQGAGLKQIREACRQRVEARPEADPSSALPPAFCRVSIPGPHDAMCAGFAQALQRAYDKDMQERPQDPIAVEIRIPPSWVGMVIGKGGEKLKAVRSTYSVEATVGREPVWHAATGAEERALTLTGPGPALPQALQLLITSNRGPGAGGAPAGLGNVAGLAGLAGIPGLSQLTAGASPQGERADNSNSAPRDPDEVRIQVVIPSQLAGVIIGKGGERIKQTGTQSGCYVKMAAREEGAEKRLCIVSGALEPCIVAQTALWEQLKEGYASNNMGEPQQFSTTMLLPRVMCGAVIGKQGATVNALRQQTGVQIQLDNESREGDTRPCKIEGGLMQVALAQRMVHAVIKQECAKHPEKLAAMQAGGSQGAGSQPPSALATLAQALQQQPHLAAQLGLGQASAGLAPPPPPPAPPMAGFQEQPPAKRARTDGGPPNMSHLGPECETKLLVPEASAGYVIGTKGANLQAARETFGVHVKVVRSEEAPHWIGERMVIVKGPSGTRPPAVEHVANNAFAKQQPNDNVCLKLLVPYEKLGYVVGEEGAILRWLMDNFGVITEVGTENVQGDHVFMLHGPKANVLQAARQTTSLLDTEASAAAPQEQPEPQAALPVPAPPPVDPATGMAPMTASTEAQYLAQYQQQL